MPASPRQEPDLGDPLDALPADARDRLERFSAALERVTVEDLPLYAVRADEAEHQRAAEAAAAVARATGLEAPIDAAREVVVAWVSRQYGAAQFRTGYVALNTAPGLGPTDDRVRVMRSIGDAVTAIVLGETIDEADGAELLGAWANLLP